MGQNCTGELLGDGIWVGLLFSPLRPKVFMLPQPKFTLQSKISNAPNQY
jgi:hypothetical protein